MAERPILFSGPMVLALLDGRKTVTRRVLKVPTCVGPRALGGGAYTRATMTNGAALLKGDGVESRTVTCPYGQPGDRLWVRETLKRGERGPWCYAADTTAVTLPKDSPSVPAMLSWAHHKDGDTCVSIHMPRWASRLTLELVSIRCERLHDISEEDCQAEGVTCQEMERHAEPCRIVTPSQHWRYHFETLWRDINGAESWAANPWVWRVEFKRVAP